MKLQCFDIQLFSWLQQLQKLLQLPFAMCSYKELFTLGQGRPTAMPAFDRRLKGANPLSFNRPELVHTIIATGQYMLTILQWQNVAD